MEPRELYQVLYAKAGFEVVNDHVGEKQLRVLGRVDNKRMPVWLVVIQRLLAKAEQSSWNVDISKQYFLRDGKLLFAWRVIFQGDEIGGHLQEIADIATEAPVMRQEIMEVPIQRSAHRTQMRHGRGAQSIAGDAGTPPIVSVKLGG